MLAPIIIPIILALVALYLHKHLLYVDWNDNVAPLKLYNWEIVLGIVVLLIPVANIILYSILLAVYIAGLGCDDLRFDKKSKIIEWLCKDALNK